MTSARSAAFDRDRIASLALVLLLTLTFGNSLLARYAVHDDYWSLDAGQSLGGGDQGCAGLVQTASLIQVGRPLAAVVHCALVYGLPPALEIGVGAFYAATSLLRLASFLCLIATALSFAAVLRRMLPPFEAAAVTALILLLPGAGVLVAWSVMSIYAPGLLLIAGANLLLLPWLDRIAMSSTPVFGAQDAGRLGLVALCVGTALLFYQMNGFVLLLTPLAMVLFWRTVPWDRRRIAVTSIIGAFLAGVLLYFAVQKGLVEGSLRAWLLLPPSTERTVTIGSGATLIENLLFFLGYPLRRALNLWIVYDPPILQRFWSVLAAAGIVAGTVVWSIRWQWRRQGELFQSTSMLIERAVAIGAILALCAAINFVGEKSIKFRVLWPFQACLVLLMVAWIGFIAAPIQARLAQARWRTLRRTLAVILVSAAGLASASATGRHYVAHVAAELGFLEAAYSQFQRDTRTTLVIVRGHPHGRIYGDEYTVMTGSFFDAPYGIGGMLAVLDRKYMVERKSYRIDFRPGFVVLSRGTTSIDNLAPGDPGLHVVDFKDLAFASGAPFVGVTPGDIVAVTAASTPPAFGAEHLAHLGFRHPPWSIAAPNTPETVTFEFATARSFRGLTLVLPVAGARADAPRAMSVQYWSEESQSWVQHADYDNLCPRYPDDGMAKIVLPAPTPPAGKLRLSIRANCGGPNLTLQAVAFQRD